MCYVDMFRVFYLQPALFTELRERSHLILVKEVPRKGGKAGNCAKRGFGLGELCFQCTLRASMGYIQCNIRKEMPK